MELFGIDGADISQAASYETIMSSGVSFNNAVEWMNFYLNEALVNPANPVAAARAAQLSNIVAFWP